MLIMKETVPFDEPIGCVAKDTARPIFVKAAIPDYAITLNEALGLRDVKPICGRGDGSALVFRVRNAAMQQLEVMLMISFVAYLNNRATGPILPEPITAIFMADHNRLG